MCTQRQEVPELLYREELPELELLEQKTRTVLLRKGKIYLASGSHCMFALERSRVVICIVKCDESQAAKSSFFFNVFYLDKALIRITEKTFKI